MDCNVHVLIHTLFDFLEDHNQNIQHVERIHLYGHDVHIHIFLSYEFKTIIKIIPSYICWESESGKFGLE